MCTCQVPLIGPTTLDIFPLTCKAGILTSTFHRGRNGNFETLRNFPKVTRQVFVLVINLGFVTNSPHILVVDNKKGVFVIHAASLWRGSGVSASPQSGVCIDWAATPWELLVVKGDGWRGHGKVLIGDTWSFQFVDQNLSCGHSSNFKWGRKYNLTMSWGEE